MIAPDLLNSVVWIRLMRLASFGAWSGQSSSAGASPTSDGANQGQCQNKPSQIARLF